MLRPVARRALALALLAPRLLRGRRTVRRRRSRRDAFRHQRRRASGRLRRRGWAGPCRALGWRRAADAINARGEIVGASSNSEGYVAFRYHDGALRDLGALGATGRSSAYDINDAGQIVGQAEAAFADPPHAFLWEEGRGMRDLGTLPGFAYSLGNAINGTGQVVGVNGGAGPPYRAFRWSAERGMRALDGLDADSWATDINDAGQIVGWHGGGAFIWSEGGGVRDLGVLAGDDWSDAAAVNAAGWAVGRSQRTDSASNVVARATLFAHGRAIDLDGLIPPDSGWVLVMATDINDAGQIVGIGVRDGLGQGFQLTPTGAPGTFCDVTTDAPYAAAVADLAARGVVGGYGDGCFGPGIVASRAEVAAFVARHARRVRQAHPRHPDAPRLHRRWDLGLRGLGQRLHRPGRADRRPLARRRDACALRDGERLRRGALRPQ